MDIIQIVPVLIQSAIALRKDKIKTVSLHKSLFSYRIMKKGDKNMANESKKDFNAMLMDNNDMPKLVKITDSASIKKYGGDRMYFAPPCFYDEVMKTIPFGKLTTVGEIRKYFAKKNDADFTDPITAGIFTSIVAWASVQRKENETPYWRTLKNNGELNPKYPEGIEFQKQKLESEGHTIIQKGRTNIRYYVKDYEKSLQKL